ncbi:tRNA (N6-threonylcarbamoyladenosine(37)-N6)-methyltransferase TrmO [Methanocella arvoryzae]|uniref:tRNA (N6-threonylcarbamoyladenosine(37)-N6)-methyltransferase TrmO n=1 Tax=Methanocella arvoryzae TaxID=1175445 RepID=UPI0003211845|nr:tRNA (N6-threonylcarbamoyladenosine(37)-N6)-methyltransferase TrmO [Methanocella arvoryzae]
MEEIKLEPIGIVHSSVRERKDMPLQGVEAEIEVFREYEEGLMGIEENSHLFVVCWLDKAERDTLQVTPRKYSVDLPKRGVFAIRTPVRPNPVSITTARLIQVRGRLLTVSHLDAINGTPVIDLKPYEPGWDCVFSAARRDRYQSIKKMMPAEYRDDLIRQAVNYHGEECQGLAMAVRMAAFATLTLKKDLRNSSVCILIGKNACISDSLIGITGARLGNKRLYYNLNPKLRESDSYSIYDSEKTIVFRIRKFMKDYKGIMECDIKDIFDIEVI